MPCEIAPVYEDALGDSMSLDRVVEKLHLIDPHAADAVSHRGVLGLPWDEIARRIGRTASAARIDFLVGRAAVRSALEDGGRLPTTDALRAFRTWLEAGVDAGAYVPALERLVRALDRSEIATLSDRTLGPAVSAGVMWSPQLPCAFGSYCLVELLGIGGMGAVYRAEQKSPSRVVAVKTLRDHGGSQELARRFRQEPEFLARLHHPSIAQVFEAGVVDTDAGEIPFFAMEYVDGPTITDYVNEHEPGIEERLELAARIAEAVHHAHGKRVIHRDIKPSNVLVNADGVPKVLDFGIAKLLSDADAEAESTTRSGFVVGTLSYMSSEQASGVAEVDVRTDVYSLGALTYELLAGRPPLPLDGLPVHRALARIEVDDPVPLSAVSRAYRGDVEAIVATALRKNPEHRYATAADFADDIRRFLAHEPVYARHTGFVEQVRRLARRNPTATAIAGTSALIVLVGLLAWNVRMGQLNRAIAKQRDEESSLRADADWKNAFLERMLELANARTSGVVRTMPEVLRITTEDMGDGPSPLATFELRERLAKWALDMGELAIAEEQIARLSATPNPGPEADLRRRNLLAGLLYRRGNPKGAAELYRSAAEDAKKWLGSDAQVTVHLLGSLGTMLFRAGQGELALPHLLEAVRGYTRLFGQGAPQTWPIHGTLAELYLTRADIRAAERHAELVARSATSSRSTEFAASQAQSALARVRRYQGRLEDSAEIWKLQASVAEELLGPTHRDTEAANNNLASVLIDLGRLPEAEGILRSQWTDRVRRGDPDNDATLRLQTNLAHVVWRQARSSEAISLLRDALQSIDASGNQESPVATVVRNNLATVFCDQGEYDEAIRLMDESIAVETRLRPEAISDIVKLDINLARILGDCGRYDHARDRILPWLSRPETAPPLSAEVQIGLLLRLAVVLAQSGEYAAAAEWARNGLQTASESDPNSAMVPFILQTLGVSQIRIGQPVEGEDTLRQAERKFTAESDRLRTRAFLGEALIEQGRLDQAELCLREVEAALAELNGVPVRYRTHVREQFARIEAARSSSDVPGESR